MIDNEIYWIIDCVASILASPRWEAEVLSFVDENCIIFDSEEENKLQFMTVHREFINLVDNVLRERLLEFGISEKEFSYACLKFSETCKKSNSTRTDNAQEKEILDRNVIDQIYAMADFQGFKNMMLKRNLELQIEAMEALKNINGCCKQVCKNFDFTQEEKAQEINESTSPSTYPATMPSKLKIDNKQQAEVDVEAVVLPHELEDTLNKNDEVDKILEMSNSLAVEVDRLSFDTSFEDHTISRKNGKNDFTQQEDIYKEDTKEEERTNIIVTKNEKSEYDVNKGDKEEEDVKDEIYLTEEDGIINEEDTNQNDDMITNVINDQDKTSLKGDGVGSVKDESLNHNNDHTESSRDPDLRERKRDIKYDIQPQLIHNKEYDILDNCEKSNTSKEIVVSAINEFGSFPFLQTHFLNEKETLLT
jgi:hypothetical protein